MAAPPDGIEYFFDKEWSDGLPVVPPTGERLAAMLAGTTRDPEELIGLGRMGGKLAVQAMEKGHRVAGYSAKDVPEHLSLLLVNER